MPLALAFCTYYGSSWRPGKHVNHGVLITPPRALPATARQCCRLPGRGAASFRGQWWLVYVGDGAAMPTAAQALFVMRQTRLALNNDMTRVRPVFLAPRDCCAQECLAHNTRGCWCWMRGGGRGGTARAVSRGERAHTLFMVDPLGNLMMSYDARQNPRGLLEDLKKLLRLSHIG